MVYHVKSQDYSDVSAQNITKAHYAQAKKKLKSLGKEKCSPLAFESVNGINSTKWRRQLVPRARSGHSKRAITK